MYGRHPVREVLQRSPRDIRRLYVVSQGRLERLGDLLREAERAKVPVVEVQRRALEDLVGDVPHQGVVALVAAFAYADVSDMLAEANRRDEAPLLVALDSVQDPQNLGSLVRSSLALGAHGLLFPKDRACEVTPTVVKASAGATAHLLIGRVTNLRRTLDELKESGLWVVGAVAEGGMEVTRVDWIQPTVLVIGSEGKGMRPLVARSCDVLAQIPMAGPTDEGRHIGSLNAAVAGAICLYEAARQRRSS